MVTGAIFAQFCDVQRPQHKVPLLVMHRSAWDIFNFVPLNTGSTPGKHHACWPSPSEEHMGFPDISLESEAGRKMKQNAQMLQFMLKTNKHFVSSQLLLNPNKSKSNQSYIRENVVTECRNFAEYRLNHELNRASFSASNFNGRGLCFAATCLDFDAVLDTYNIL